MEKTIIFTGTGARVLSKQEMKHVLGGTEDLEISQLDPTQRDLSACKNKKCSKRSDCGTGICASMECNGVKQYHCI